MGMYDTVFTRIDLPLNEDLQKLSTDWKDVDFQTKDLENALFTYYLNPDKTLTLEIVEREYIEYTEEEKKTAKPWNIYKDVKVISKREENTNYHGSLVFYTFVDIDTEPDYQYWIEFEAYFVYGKLDKIELKKCEKEFSQCFRNKEWEEERKKEQQLPWNRFKRLMGYVGWYWFWKKVSKVCYSFHSFFSNLHAFIIRHCL